LPRAVLRLRPTSPPPASSTVSLHDALPISRTGVHEAEFETADRRIRSLIAQANERANQLHHVDDTPFGWQLEIADVMVTDISAVDRKSTRLNSSHVSISYAVFCLKKQESDP